MDITVEYFLGLNPTRQISLLKEMKFKKLSREERIDFIKTVLQSELSSKTTASALKVLRELKYRDQLFFRQFLYHADSSVANAARKAISDAIEQKDSGIIKITEILKKERGESRMEYLESILKDKIDFNADMLLSLLSIDDSSIREKLIREINRDYNLDEARLVEAIKGSVWHVRAAIVKVLSNRQSDYLLDVIEYLMDDKNVEVKLSLIDALSGIDPHQARVYLERLKQDSLVWVKKQAEKVLANTYKDIE
ncbi:MAG: HEAT repeat domain-containing protein [Candidatus Aminicenantes bacterium]|nr:HEAT repeat domain-containing protein [Candidatus Aminicenantes bacterium]